MAMAVSQVLSGYCSGGFDAPGHSHREHENQHEPDAFGNLRAAEDRREEGHSRQAEEDEQENGNEIES